MSAPVRERLAIAIFAACWRQYDQYRIHSGPTPEKAWANISEEQRAMFRHYADAAVQFMSAEGWGG